MVSPHGGCQFRTLFCRGHGQLVVNAHVQQSDLSLVWFDLEVLLSETLPEFSVYNPGALFRKSLSNNIDFLNSAPGVVHGKLWCL